MGVGAKSMVSSRALGRDRHRRIAVLGRRNLPTYYMGNGTPRARGRSDVLRLFHSALARVNFVFSSACVGIRCVLHRFRRRCGCQLVLDSSATVPKAIKPWRHLRMRPHLRLILSRMKPGIHGTTTRVKLTSWPVNCILPKRILRVCVRRWKIR
jgi:hypothetical protein